jgi:hypothetical protein
VKSAEEVNKEFWRAMTEQATRGNVEAAQDVLVTFVETVEQFRMLREPEEHWNGPIPWAGADHLAKAFRKILNGEDHAKALCLRAATVGRRKGKTVFHDQEALAASYYFLLRSDFRPEQANKVLREQIGADRSTSLERLKVSMQPYAKKVAAILSRRIK